MKSKRVWGYKLTMIKNGGGKKEYVRYTPMEFEVDGMRFWYETDSDDRKDYKVTHADSGIAVTTLRNCKVKDIPEQFSLCGSTVLNIQKRIADKDEKLLHEAMEEMKDVMAYAAQFDSVNNFIKGKEGNYPPEKIPFDAYFVMDFGELKMFVGSDA